ncbi:MAG: InlB B-repeat-containing protein, partial [Bacilli bacterium]|nr:InlB B-repeat-containing protein [Bacilli bacterium]
MFNKKRIVVFVTFILLMFFMSTFAGAPVQNASIVTRDVIFTDSFNGENISEQKVELGKAAIVPESPKHRNFVFAGWFEFDDHDVKVENFDRIMEDTHVIALYDADINNNGIADKDDQYFTVRFIDSISGRVLKSQEVLIGMNATAPVPVQREGYTFAGWDRAYTNVERDIDVNTIYRSVPVEEEKITHTITFVDGETGKVISTQEVEEGLSATTPSSPEHDKRVFDYYEGDYTNVTDDETIVIVYTDDKNDNDIKDYLEPHYSVEFKSTGRGKLVGQTKYTNVLTDLSFEDAGIVIPEIVADKYYEAKGWNPEIVTKVTDNATYTMTFGPINDENNNGIADEEEYFNVDAEAKENGTALPAHQSINYGKDAETIVFAPEGGYTIKSLKVDGEELTTEGESRETYVTNGYTFKNVKEDHTLVVIFGEDENNNNIPDDEEDRYIISTSVNGGNGTVSPNGKTEMLPGESLYVTFRPDTGYTIKSLIVDDKELATEKESRETYVTDGYAFNNVEANHTLVVSYGKDENGNNIPDDEEEFTVTASAGENGSVNPTTQTVKYGADAQTITITPADGYTIKSLKVDNVELTTEGESRETYVTNGYTFTEVKEDHTLEVTFYVDRNDNNIPDDEEDHFTITTSVEGENGTVEPEGETDLIKGESLTVTLTPSEGYTIKSLKVDNEELATEKESRETYVTDGYAFNNIEANHTLVVSYGKDENGNNIPDDEEEFTVIFANEGTIIKRETVVYGNAATEPAITPTKPATAQYTYTFAGWDKDFSYITEDLTVNATYTSSVNGYTVKFVNDDGTEISSEVYEYGTAASDIVVPADPEKASTAQYTYTFAGWTPEIANVTGDATYTATYTSTTNEYLIKFVDEDGTELQSSNVAYGQTPSYTGETPEKASTAEYEYTFAGWTPEIASVTGNATYTATYTSAVRNYTIKFVDEDGTEISSTEYEYGTLASDIEVP